MCTKKTWVNPQACNPDNIHSMKVKFYMDSLDLRSVSHPIVSIRLCYTNPPRVLLHYIHKPPCLPGIATIPPLCMSILALLL